MVYIVYIVYIYSLVVYIYILSTPTICPVSGRVRRDHHHHHYHHHESSSSSPSWSWIIIIISSSNIQCGTWWLTRTPRSPHPTPCERSINICSINIVCKAEGTRNVASTSCARSKERVWRIVNIPTPPHVSVASTSADILFKVEGMRLKGTLTSTPPHPM